MKIYHELADWFRLLTAPEDYAEEAALFLRLLREHGQPPQRSLLELGSGGGHNASHLKAHFDHVVLVEPSAPMRAMSRELNPDCEHLDGDMRTVRLGRTFDSVFVHDAICYMTSRDDLRQALQTAYDHCRPGGVALFAPDMISENWRETTDHGGHDADDGRALRYLGWSWDPDPSDDTYLVEYALLLRDRSGSVRVEHDRHVEGMFPRGDWLQMLRAIGFTPTAQPLDHSELDPGTYEVFVARKT
jgi:SAM-dependent methyltransferase